MSATTKLADLLRQYDAARRIRDDAGMRLDVAAVGSLAAERAEAKFMKADNLLRVLREEIRKEEGRAA